MRDYEYECSTCGAFELRRPPEMASRAADCPSCGKAAKRRYIFNTSVSLRTVEATPARREDRKVAEFGGAWLENCDLSGNGYGIVGSGGEVGGQNVKIHNSSLGAIKARGTRIAIDNLDIA